MTWASGRDRGPRKPRDFGDELSPAQPSRQVLRRAEPVPGRGRCCAAREIVMRKLLLVGLGLCLFGALWRAEEEEDGTAVALSPFLAALALEAGIFPPRRPATSLLG